MRKTPLEPEDARDLTIYMLALQDVNLPKEYLPSDKYKELYEARHPPLADGEALYREFCYGCHEDAVEGKEDDILRAELPAIRNPHYLSRVSNQDLALMIRRGRPGTDMPAWHEESGGLRDAEIDALVEYIAVSRKTVSTDTFVVLTPQDAEAGRVLYEEYCLDCHGERGRGDWAPSFADPVFQEVYDDPLLGLTIRDGIDNTGMMSFREEGFTDQEISDVMAYIRSFVLR
jgi:mono/diheme cytochrome c family protein